MKITWRDEDGDDVSIESDEELLIALHEMKGKSQVQNKYIKKGPKWFGPNWIRQNPCICFSHKEYSLLYF